MAKVSLHVLKARALVGSCHVERCWLVKSSNSRNNSHSNSRPKVGKVAKSSHKVAKKKTAKTKSWQKWPKAIKKQQSVAMESPKAVKCSRSRLKVAKDAKRTRSCLKWPKVDKSEQKHQEATKKAKIGQTWLKVAKKLPEGGQKR